jgi:hypothetical protein
MRWATQDFIPGRHIFIFRMHDSILETETRSGNLAIVAAAQVAPVGYSDLNALLQLLKCQQFLKPTFYDYPSGMYGLQLKMLTL